jgi:hypothetical protein
MVTKKRISPYDCIKGSPILERGEKLVPFNCFDEPRDWIEIGKEMDKLTYEKPVWDNRIKGWNWIYTRKE